MDKLFLAEFEANENPVQIMITNAKNKKQALKAAKKEIKKNNLQVDRTITIKEIYIQ